MGYESPIQQKNIAWLLPRPKLDHYKGGMPLYCEEWLIELAKDILGKKKIELLNLFCGMCQLGYRVDINPKVKPDLLCDVHNVAFCLETQYDIIFADPPYSQKECEKLYGVKIKLSYKIWTCECLKLLKKGGLLIIYHKHLVPNPDPEKLHVIKRVFVGTRPLHVPRVAVFFKKG